MNQSETESEDGMAGLRFDTPSPPRKSALKLALASH
jgi:hypothetical protein